MASEKCTRCRGTGYWSRSHPRTHLGVPGLCFDCDGDGTRETQLAKKNAAAAAKALTPKQDPIRIKIDAVNRMVWDICQANGGVAFPPSDRPFPFKKLEVFTTEDYARATGLTKKEAWIELCRWRDVVYPALDHDGNPVGWFR